MVLEFESDGGRKRFLQRLESFFSSPNERLHVDTLPVFRATMLAEAETKERRQRRLERFFREAYSLTFGLR